MNKKQKEIFERTMTKFSEGKLFTASGDKVNDIDKARVIANAEAGTSRFKRRMSSSDTLKALGVPEDLLENKEEIV